RSAPPKPPGPPPPFAPTSRNAPIRTSRLFINAHSRTSPVISSNPARSPVRRAPLCVAVLPQSWALQHGRMSRFRRATHAKYPHVLHLSLISPRTPPGVPLALLQTRHFQWRAPWHGLRGTFSKMVYVRASSLRF